MKVSVILPVYNGEKFLEGTIKSILNQSFKDFELVIVNDGSTDESEKIIKSFEDKRIKYIVQQNTGAPAAPRNIAIKEAGGELIAFCDQDDLWELQKLQKQIEAYEKSAQKDKIGIICSQAVLIDVEGSKITENKPPFSGFVEPKIALEALLNSNFITACSALVPKMIITKMGGLDESLVGNDEFDLWLRITHKYGVLVVPEKLCKLRKSAGALSENISKMYVENEKIFKKLDPKDNLVQRGHQKNLNKIFTYSILEGNFAQADAFMGKVAQPSRKLKFIIGLYGINKTIAQLFLLVLKRYNRI